MSNVQDSQSESLGEVTSHLAGAIGLEPTSEYVGDGDVAYHSHAEGSGPVISHRDHSHAEAVSEGGYEIEERDYDEVIPSDSVCRGDVDSPRAVVSGNRYGINIETKNYGFVVNIGCQSFAVEKPETVGAIIAKFLANPVEAEKAWYNTSGNNRLEETLKQFS